MSKVLTKQLQNKLSRYFLQLEKHLASQNPAVSGK